MNLTIYIGIFVALIVGGFVAILIVRHKRSKNAKKEALNVVVFIPQASGITYKTGVGYMKPVNTQKMLDIPMIDRILDYPDPAQLINNTMFYIQTSKITYRPLILQHKGSDSPALAALKVKLKAAIETNDIKAITGNDLAAALSYIDAEKLVPELDPAYLIIYANNVERIVKATAVEGNDVWSKISKLMPAIVILVTAVAIAIILYAFLPMYQAVASSLHSGLQVSCVVANATKAATTTSALPIP